MIMTIMAFILLIISLSKICLVLSYDKYEEYNNYILESIPPKLLDIIIKIDASVGLICSLYLLTVIL